MPLIRAGNGASEFDSRPSRVPESTLREKLVNLFNPYRPYKHYMRGPGPKCRRKEAGADATSWSRGSVRAWKSPL